MNTKTKFLSIVTAATLALAALPATGAAGDPNGPPDVREVFFSHVEDGTFRSWELDATIRRADSVTFRTRYAGERTAAPGRQTQGHGRNWWIARGDHDLIPLIRRQLDERGFAEIGITAHGPNGRDRVRVRIHLGECHTDPPYYPLSCSVRT
jgi:hypothetical protein